MSFSPSESAFEGFRIARRSPMAVLIWALFFVVLTVAIFALVGTQIMGFLQMSEGLETGGEPSMEEVSAVMGAYLSMMALIFPLSLIAGAVMYTGVNRAVLRPEDSRFGYLRLGMDEVRVGVVYLVLSILGGIVCGLIYALGVGLAVGAWAALRESSPAVAMLVGFAIGVGALALILWLVVRYSLAIAITVAERRIAIFDSWSLTKGHFWGLLGMNLLALVMAIVVQLLVSIVALPILFFTLGGFENIEALQTMPPAEIFQTMAPFAIVAVLFSGLLSALQAAIMYAPSASAYLGLKGRADGAV